MNSGSPIQIEDDENRETWDNISCAKDSLPTGNKPLKEKFKIDPSPEASFWKEKYFAVVSVLQRNLIDLELENQVLRSENKDLIQDHKRQTLELRRDKKKGSMTINSPGVNIFVHPDFKNSTS